MTRESLDGVAFYLLAEMPAWPSPVRATFELPVASEVGLSQRETRRPLGATLRTRVSFAVVASGAAARALAAGLRALRDEPVAVPFWPGAVPWPVRDAAPFATGWSLAITRDGETFEAWSGTPPTWPSGADLHVPLLVGKIETRPATWSSGESFRFEVEFEETSGAALALNVAAAQWTPGPAPTPSWAGSVPVLLPFQVAFERPTLGARVDVERERVGLGRGEAVTFYEQPSRHEGTARLSLASREDVARFVRFFLEHGAGVPFWLPFWNHAAPLSADLGVGATSASVGAGHDFAEGDWLCFTNGTALAFTQVTGATETSLALDRAPGAWKANRTRLARLALCRTERPKVTVEWASPEAAGVVFDVREVSAEYNPAPGEIRGETIGALGPRAFLYDLTVATVAGPVVERFTSFERDLEVDGNTYRAAQMEHGVIRQGLALDRDEVELRAVPDEGDTAHPLAALAALASDGPVSVTVRFVNLPGN